MALNNKLLLSAIVLIGPFTTTASAAEKLVGVMAAPGLTGRSDQPHAWVEEKLYIADLQGTAGGSAITLGSPRGRFTFPAPGNELDVNAGRPAIFTLGFDTIPALTVWKDIKGLADDKPGNDDLITPAHYSVMYNHDWKQWSEKPWVEASDFYQTFKATGPYVTRIATKLADKSGDHYHMTLNFAVYEPNDGPPSTWKRISPVRSRFLSQGTDPIIHIFWVTFRSSEVTLTPGKIYAVRFWRAEVSMSERFAMVVREDKGDGYADGHLYMGDEPRRDLDCYAYVSGGEPGTLVNHTPVEPVNVKDLIGSAESYGQTFTATGTSLAAAEAIYATGAATPPALNITFQVYDRPGGKPIGKARSCYGLPLAFQGRAAVMWERDEVKLEPGRQYYIEWKASGGCNTWKLGEDLPGEAYKDGKPVPGADLVLVLAEYDGKQRSAAK